jgi:hypothetical protein
MHVAFNACIFSGEVNYKKVMAIVTVDKMDFCTGYLCYVTYVGLCVFNGGISTKERVFRRDLDTSKCILYLVFFRLASAPGGL